MLFQIRNWLRRQEGQDLTEYALLIGLIVIVAVVAVALLGDSISALLGGVASALDSVLAGI
jgi:Flp pilus assembly pilin Flp